MTRSPGALLALEYGRKGPDQRRCMFTWRIRSPYYVPNAISSGIAIPIACRAYQVLSVCPVTLL
jgi:hypothetical protein